MFQLPKMRLEWPSSRHMQTVRPDLTETQRLRASMQTNSAFNTIASDPPLFFPKKDETLLFEYGDGMFQFPRAKWLEAGTFLRPAFTAERFSLWNTVRGRNSFPIALKGRCLPESPVYGQLYKVPQELLNQDLDYHRENGVVFNRKPVELLIPYDRQYQVFKNESPAKCRSFSEVDYKPLVAWMYVGCKSYWKEPLEWDQNFFRNSGGSDLHLANKFKDWTLNRKFFKFNLSDIAHDNFPTTTMKFFHTRSFDTQRELIDIDIREEDEWNKQQRIAEVADESSYPHNRLS